MRSKSANLFMVIRFLSADLLKSAISVKITVFIAVFGAVMQNVSDTDLLLKKLWSVALMGIN